MGKLEIHSRDIKLDGTVTIHLNDTLISELDISNQGRAVNVLFPKPAQQHNTNKQYRPRNHVKWKTLCFPVPEGCQPQNNDKVRISLSQQPVLEGIFYRD